MERQELIKKIEELSAEQLAQVENLVESLANADNENLHRTLVDYATKYAGTAGDLDIELEAASVQHLADETSD